MEMKIQRGKKILVLLLAFLIAFTYMPFGIGMDTAEATSAVETGTFKKGDVLVSGNKSKFEYTGKDAGWMQIYFVTYEGTGGFKIGPVQEISPIRKYRVNGDVAYCIEHGVMDDETVRLTGRPSENAFLETVYDKADLKYILNNMSLCLLYGRQSGRSMDVLYNELGFKDSAYYHKNKSYNLDDWEAATRQLIHESQQRFRDKEFNKLSTNGLYFEDHWYKGVTNPGTGTGTKIPKSHYRKPLEGTGAEDIYDHMARLIKDHLQLSLKMGGDREGNPKTMKLTKADDGKWYSDKISITKKEAIAVKMVKANGEEYKNYHINIVEKGGDYYYQYCLDSEPNWDKTYTVKKKIDYFKQVPDDMLIWECKDGKGGHVQALATGSCDPIARYVKFTDEPIPEPQESEPPEPEYFPTIQISVEKEDLNPGWDGDKHTPMGDATLAATYVLLRDGVEVDRVTLDEYGRAETLSDTPWPDVSALTKIGSGTTATHLVGNPPSDHCGTDGPTRYDWDGEVTYEVKEIRPDGRFIEPDSGKRSMTVTYNAFTRDTRSYACQTPNWTDIVYTVKTTQTDGITFSDQNGTIDFVEDPIYADADTFINDCYRGKLTLSKSLENSDVFSERKSGTVGGEKDSTKSRWKMRLNSGGYENHPYVRFVREADLADGTAVYRVTRDTSGESNETSDMEIGTNGDLLVLDIPYGEYTMSEASTDDISYVKEHFKVEIGEHNKSYDVTEKNDDRYDYNVRDKKKTNIVKVIKTNAETGKQVRAAGTKFYIRYMGDPLLADPTSAKNYGRLLPNAEDITKDGPYTWEADENAAITIPYELEWGIYRLEEWLLPEGYFAGEYEDGSARSHDYGKVEEGQQKALLGHGYSDLVGIYDETGEKVSYKDKDSYKVNEVFNFYTFTVEKQEDHADGNFAQKVTADKVISRADEQYDSEDYPYTNYYKAVAMANNNVKGKIEVIKEGEALTGFAKSEKDGRTIFTPIFEKVAKLKDAVFGIFAAKDETLNDGSDGPDIYDSNTDEKVTIPKTKSTHFGNLLETITSALSRFFKGSGDIYETGELEHNSGAKLWYLRDRAAKEDGHYTRMYVSPEQKDTTYAYSYEKEEDGFKYRYDIEARMNYAASGNAVTEIKVTKVSTVKDGYSLRIPETKPEGSVGDVVLSPIESYLAKDDETSIEKKSSLSVTDKSYTYELMGGSDTDINGNEVDLSDIGVSAYIEKNYVPYKLTASDVKTEERVVKAAEDNDGDGVFEVPEVKETRTAYEWKNDCELVTRNKDDKAVVKVGDGFAVETTGYYQNGIYTAESSMVRCDAAGNPVASYEIPDGYTLVPFNGDTEEDAHYIIVSKTEGEGTTYQILLNDGTWQECDEKGNFKKMLVQCYDVKYEQVAGDDRGFTFSWDGFTVNSKASKEDKNVVTKITKQDSRITPIVEVGAGYTYEDEGLTMTFTGTDPDAPVYFLSKDGIKTKMYYAGGEMKVTMEIPQGAVDKDYEYVVPTINFKENGNDNIINWYKDLSPDNHTAKGTPVPGASWKAERIESAETGKAESYLLEIFAKNDSDNPLEITFSDGYKMSIFTDIAESGNGVGVLVLDNVYKTIRASLGELVDTITTGADGRAVSRLLPIGDYIVRELESGDNYKNDGEDRLVSLKYKDQFTPLIWESTGFENAYFTVEIDISKVLEVFFDSDIFTAPDGEEKVTFGLYAGEDISASATGSKKVTKTAIEKDTLIDTVTFTEENKGKALITAKLPEGRYYFKEIETTKNHVLSDAVYPFMVREDMGDYSEKVDFNYATDGISGKLVQEREGKVRTYIRIETRYPMPSITIDGKTYPLDKEYPVSETKDEAGKVIPGEDNGYVKIDVDKDFTEVEVTSSKEAPTAITLPNGKDIKIEAEDNTYKYTLDGVEKEFIPTVSYTGYHASYEALFSRIKGEDLNEHTRSFTLTGAGSDKADIKVSVSITHSPEKTVTTKEEPIDPNQPELGMTTVTQEKGNLTPGGYQIFKHSAVIKAEDSLGANIIPAQFERTSGKKTVTENLDASGEILLHAKDTVTFKSLKGGTVTVTMDKYGNVKCDIENTLANGFSDADNSVLETDGVVDDTYHFSKNVTLARQDTSAGHLMIKINSDNKDGFAIENDHVPRVKIKKVDKDNHATTLAGAEFAIYKAKYLDGEDWKCIPGELIGTFITGTDGIAGMDLDYGVYFWQETKAPAGYRCDIGYHKFRVAKAEDPYLIEVENDKGGGDDGGGHSYYLEITKYDELLVTTLADAEFEIYGSHKDEAGNIARDEKPYFNQKFVTGEYGKVMIRFTTPGIYFLHETKAPEGYKLDESYYQVEIGKDGKSITKVDVKNEKKKNPNPEISTTATGENGEKLLKPEGKVTIVDTVKYINLIPGKTYTMKGILMDKEAGEPILSGGKEVTSEVTFTPKKSSGTVKMTFKVDAKALAGKSVVVFEDCYLDGAIVASHADINDEGQTVRFKKLDGRIEFVTKRGEGDDGKVGVVPKTGDSSQLKLMLILMLLSLCALLTALKLKK